MLQKNNKEEHCSGTYRAKFHGNGKTLYMGIKFYFGMESLNY